MVLLDISLIVPDFDNNFYSYSDILPKELVNPLGCECDLFFEVSIDNETFVRTIFLLYSLPMFSRPHESSLQNNMFVIKNPFNNKFATFEAFITYDQNFVSWEPFSDKTNMSYERIFFIKLKAKIPPYFFHIYNLSQFYLSLKIISDIKLNQE